MQAGRLVVIPGGKRVLPQLLPLLLAPHILLNGLPHDPMRRPPPRQGEPLHTLFQFKIELQAGGGGYRHIKRSKVLPGGTLSRF